MTNYREYITDARVHISDGNTKTGRIPSFSTMPTDGLVTLKDGTACTNVRGTCDGVCKSCAGSCYAVRSVRQYKQTAAAWSENTIAAYYDPIMIRDAVADYIQLNDPRYFRIHVSGEFIDLDYMRLWALIAHDNPRTVFYGYTKRADLLEMYRIQYGPMPSNMVLQFSVWHNLKDAPAGYPLFAYDDGTDADVASWAHCPAVDAHGRKTGITCTRCRRCITCGPDTRTAVYAH